MPESKLPLKVVICDLETIKTFPIDIVSIETKAEISRLMLADGETLPLLEEIVVQSVDALLKEQSHCKEIIESSESNEADCERAKKILALSLVSTGFLYPPEKIQYKVAPCSDVAVKYRDASGEGAARVKTKEAPIQAGKGVKTRETGGSKVKRKEAPTQSDKKVKHRNASGDNPQVVVKHKTIGE